MNVNADSNAQKQAAIKFTIISYMSNLTMRRECFELPKLKINSFIDSKITLKSRSKVKSRSRKQPNRSISRSNLRSKRQQIWTAHIKQRHFL